MAFGQFTATISWDNASADLLLILVCGGTEPLTCGVAGGGMDRTGRLESGLIAFSLCLIGVSTLNGTAAYRLNLQSSSDQLSTPRFATVDGVTPTAGGLLDARLVEYAEGVRCITRCSAEVVRNTAGATRGLAGQESPRGPDQGRSAFCATMISILDTSLLR